MTWILWHVVVTGMWWWQVETWKPIKSFEFTQETAILGAAFYCQQAVVVLTPNEPHPTFRYECWPSIIDPRDANQKSR